MDRWATFDCYGTLVDWNAGIRSVVGDELLARYHEVEPQIESEQPSLSYRDVMREALRRLEVADVDALGRSLPGWPVFPEVPAALEAAREAGWKLAILSNTDRDFIEASMASIGVPFELAIVASEVGSYKPAPGHWRAFEREVGRLPDVHVARVALPRRRSRIAARDPDRVDQPPRRARRSGADARAARPRAATGDTR